MQIREPVVSGQFYPSSPSKLSTMIKNFTNFSNTKVSAKVVISPHAGYIYSGSVAGEVFAKVLIPNDIILLGPNHTGLGRRFSIMKECEWRIPLGNIIVNTELAELITKNFEKIEDDSLAHMGEHSLEVQLPFLYFINPKINIVPITIMYGTHEELKLLGKAIAESIKSYKKDVLIVVSSDMSHYISHQEALNRDKKAIEKILNFDSKGLLDVCKRFDITMCGIFPAVVGIEAALSLNAKHANLVKYTTSGEVSGDYNHVVGYAGIIIS